MPNIIIELFGNTSNIIKDTITTLKIDGVFIQDLKGDQSSTFKIPYTLNAGPHALLLTSTRGGKPVDIGFKDGRILDESGNELLRFFPYLSSQYQSPSEFTVPDNKPTIITEVVKPQNIPTIQESPTIPIIENKPNIMPNTLNQLGQPIKQDLTPLLLFGGLVAAAVILK